MPEKDADGNANSEDPNQGLYGFPNTYLSEKLEKIQFIPIYNKNSKE